MTRETARLLARRPKLRAFFREHLRAVVALSGVVVVLLLMQRSSPMPAVHGDGYYTYLWARTLVYDHDLDFANDYAICGDPGGFGDLPVGKNVNMWNMGPALFWAPILAVDRITNPASHSPDPQVAAGCKGELPERAVHGSTIAGILTVVLGYLIARRRFGEWPSIFGAAGIGLLTSMTYYTTMMLSYGHAASAFAGALFVWLWDGPHARGTKRTALGWAALGAATGLAMLMRSQNVVIAVLALAEWCVEGRAAAKVASAARTRVLLRHIAIGALYVIVTVIVFSPQLAYCKKVSGHWFTVLQSEHYMRWGTPNVMRALFSSANGLYPWSPILYPATLGLVLLARRVKTRALGLGLLVVFALDAYVTSCVWDWWGSIGYPGRRFDLIAAPMMVGLAACARALYELDRRRRGAAVAILGGVTLFFGGYATWGVQFGLARAMRTDLARESPEPWKESFTYAATIAWLDVGNPLAWPASLPFALRWHVHPRRWDVLGGPELFYHEERSLERRERESTLWFDNAQHWHYLDGFAQPVENLDDMRVRVVNRPRARILLPLHYPDAGALSFRIAVQHVADAGAPVTLGLEVNGARLPPQTVPTTANPRLRFDLVPGTTHHGINEIFVVIENGSLGFERMDILDRTPTPAETQRVRDDERRRSRPP